MKNVQTPHGGITTGEPDEENPSQITGTPGNTQDPDQLMTSSISKTKLPKYPFNGESNSLILKILLIGYEKNNLEKLIRQKEKEREKEKDKEKERKSLKELTPTPDNDYDQKRKEKEKTQQGGIEEESKSSLKGFTLEESPIVLQTFCCSDSNCIENNLLLDFIFPKPPKIMPVENEKNENIKESHVVFSFNIPLEQGRKSSHNFYSYLDYEGFFVDKKGYFVPRGICFVSNFPFFDNYFSLAEYYFKEIHLKSYSKIWLYYLINLPSPINCSYKLTYFNLVQDKYYKPMLFTQLSGYPLFHFKLTELFNIMPVEFVVEIFFFSFLENDIVFFSKHLEILNIVLYIFANLNYPCNDSTYFFHIISVSLKEFKNGFNPYVSKTFSCMFGVNTSYDPEYDKYIKKNDYFIVDLEKKEIFYRYKAYRSESKDIKSNCILQDYLRQLISVKKQEMPTHSIGRAILELYFSLCNISKHITHSNVSNINQEPSFFGVQDNSYDINKTIQEKFYYFNLNILSQFYQYYSFQLPTKSGEPFTIDYDDSKINNKVDEIEAIFIQKFKECSKFNTYISNFVQNYDSLDLFKIPLLFSEEFIWQLKCDRAVNKAYSIFDTIDNFYQVEKFGVLLNFNHYYEWINKPLNSLLLNRLNEELKSYIINVIQRKKNNKPSIDMTMEEIYGYLYYFKSNPNDHKEIFSWDSSKLKYCVLSDKKYNQNTSTTLSTSNSDGKGAELDYDVLLNDTNKHLEKGIQKKIDSVKRKINQYLNGISLVSPTYIQVKIEEKIIKEDKMSAKELIFSCYILFFVITRSVNKVNTLSQLRLIITLLKKRRELYSFRKCISMLVIQYIEVIELKIINGTDCTEEKKCLLELVLLLKELNFIPNEELMKYLEMARGKGYVTVKELTDSSKQDDCEVLSLSDLEVKDTVQTTKGKNNCFLQYNITKTGIKKEDYFIRLALLSVKYNGYIVIPENELSKKNANDKGKGPGLDKPVNWVVIYGNERNVTLIYSPMKLYYSITKISKLINKDLLLLESKEKRKIIEICCNLLFYIQNLPELFNVNQKKESDVGNNSNSNVNQNESEQQESNPVVKRVSVLSASVNISEYQHIIYHIIDMMKNTSI